MKLFQNIYKSLENKFYQFYVNKFSSILVIGENNIKNLEASKLVNITDNNFDINSETFDYIIVNLNNYDIQNTFEKIEKFCDEKTVILIRYNFWQNKISLKNFIKILELTDFQEISFGHDILMPIYIPGISWFCDNILIHIPILNYLSFGRWILARKVETQKKEYAVSVIIPCRNEMGNVEQAIIRMPMLGNKMEFIFVEGHSKDNTLEEIKRVKEKYLDKDISYYIQDGKGKANAVFKGFDNAKGDILIILDGDLTIQPEELIKFYNVISKNKAQFVNGSRLIYPMEKKAMQFINFIGNHTFAFALSWIMGQRINDSLAGTKVLFKKDYALMKTNSFFFDLDPFGDFSLLLGASKLGLKIVDVPVFYKARSYGSTQIRRFFHAAILAKIVFYAVLVFKFKMFNVFKYKSKEVVK